MKSVPHIPRFIHLYDGTDVENFDIRKINNYLGQWFGPDRVQIRGEFVRHNLGKQEQILDTVAETIAKARIKDPAKPTETDQLDPEELDQERKWMIEGKPSRDIFYDGLALQQAYITLIEPQENSLEHLHIVFTDRLIGTWDQSDRRYHARVSIYGWPSIISTTGIVEGPAKPREYYFGLMAGLDEELLREEMSERFVDYGDHRLTELLKGYTMQAVFYHLWAEPFCDNPNCRGFNAHWQEEMIRAQLKSPEEFCTKHRKMLCEIRNFKERT
ncbi:MAG: hypothetical protein GWP14_09805 [Actinobacteria bacterium]|nr:hypothetical protein [Actinomycetota bacterium]